MGNINRNLNLHPYDDTGTEHHYAMTLPVGLLANAVVMLENHVI